MINRWRLTTLAVLLFALISATPHGQPSNPDSIEAILARAQKSFSEKHYQTARREFERATELDKGSMAAWSGLGWSLFKLGERQRAIALWQDLLQVRPDEPTILLALGEALEQNQQPIQALDYYGQVLQQDPANRAANLGRARILFAQQNYQEAEQVLRRVLEHAPADPAARLALVEVLVVSGRRAEAEPILRDLTASQLEPKYSRRLAELLIELGQFEQASNYYKAILHNNPNDRQALNAYIAIGWSLFKLGERQRAIALWQDLLQVRPDEPTILLALGEALEQNQQPIQALDYYGQVLQQDPANRTANLGRARILFAQQNYQEAEQMLRRVLEQAPADPAARLALVEVLVVRGRRAEAEPILRDLTAGQLEPKYSRRLAELLIELGQFEQASNYYKAILHNNPNDRQGTKGLALVYAREQRYGDAVHILAQYLRDNPNDDDLREYAAQLSENADQWDVAEQNWRMLIRAHPENSTWKIRLARLMDKAGRPEEGLAIAQDILSKEPHNTDALGLLADHAIYSGNKQEAVQWLERLTELVSDYDRSIQLANLHIDLGNSFADIGQQDQARAEYTMALQAYRVAHKLRPTSTDAHLGQLDARRLLGDTKQVIEETNQLLKTYPQLELLHDLSYTLYSEQSDYAHANQALSELRKQFPNNLNRELLYAELLFDSGRAGHAFDLTNKLSQAAIRPAVPVLLYHGISPSAYADAMPLAQFRDQLTALKKEGYQTITIHQLYRFLQGEDKALPAKPILVTFDDARDDSFRYADPVLEETGFRATMFVPTAEVGHHGLYNAFWPTIRRLQQTDRWDMQCHGDHGHRLIPIDAQGHMARFLVNQMWLTDQRRLENEQEFLNRVENDYRQCKEILSREVPGSQVIAYAYPFGDLGQKTFNNQPTALAANKRLVMKYYPMAFLQEELGFATRAIPRFALARFEVPREFSGRDLVEKLKFDPEASIAYLRGRFYADSGNYEQAMKIFQSLEQDRGIKSPNLLLEEAKVLTWSGDYAAARAHLLQAQAIRPDDPQIIRQFNRYQRQVSPMVQIDGSTYKDNQDRSNFQVGTFGQLHLTDRVALSATYHYAEFEDVSRGALPPSELSVNNQGLPNTRLHVSGHEVTGGFDYSVDNRTSLSLTGGFADFNGNTSQQFPLGSAAARLPLGEAIDIAVGATHSYVNTAGAILTGLAYTGINGDFKSRFLRDDLTLSLRHTFTHYDDGNNRNTTTVDGLRRVWLEPDIKVGYQFTYDDTEKQNPLFYTPDRFMAHEAIASIRKSFGDGFTVGGLASLGAGKEGDGGFQFQVSVGGDIRFEVANGLGLVAEANRSQAASFDSFYTFAGVYWRF